MFCTLSRALSSFVIFSENDRKKARRGRPSKSLSAHLPLKPLAGPRWYDRVATKPETLRYDSPPHWGTEKIHDLSPEGGTHRVAASRDTTCH